MVGSNCNLNRHFQIQCNRNRLHFRYNRNNRLPERVRRLGVGWGLAYLQCHITPSGSHIDIILSIRFCHFTLVFSSSPGSFVYYSHHLIVRAHARVCVRVCFMLHIIKAWVQVFVMFIILTELWSNDYYLNRKQILYIITYITQL